MREEILNLLGNQQGEYVSGESISHSLNISRAAVWKQIQGLKEAGYEIEAQTKKGYCLVKAPASLDEWALKQELKTGYLGKTLRLFEELPSTNDWCKDLVRQGEESGTVVIAKRQTVGRGRMQRAWQSPTGGLWMSVLLKPKLNLADAAKLTLSTGVALARAIHTLYGLEAGIKWPNDLVYQGKKIAGILGEVVGEWNSVQTLILGIGVNADFEIQDLSPELPATTLRTILGHEINLNQLAAEILRQLEHEVQALEQGDVAGLKERWTTCAVGIGHAVEIERAGEKFAGVFHGINENGELILDYDGREQAFSSGEVRLRYNAGQYSP